MDGEWTRNPRATQEAKAEKITFISLEEARDLTVGMDPAVKKPVLIGEYPIEIGDPARAEGVLTEKFQGVWNTATDELANIVSPHYAILQHTNFFGKVIEGLELADVGAVTGEFIRLPGGNQYRMGISFHDIEIREPTKYGGAINPGALFSNSYDKSSSARGYGYFYRNVCANGMILQHLIPGADFARNHVAVNELALLDRMAHQVWEFVYAIASSEEMVANAISLSAERELDFESRENILPTLQEMTGAVKHADGIFEILDIKDTTTTYWDLYNAFTDYASHSGVSINVQDRLQNTAERQILSPKAPGIQIATPEVVEVATV